VIFLTIFILIVLAVGAAIGWFIGGTGWAVVGALAAFALMAVAVGWMGREPENTP
jgi:uncharacterized membrane protein